MLPSWHCVGCWNTSSQVANSTQHVFSTIRKIIVYCRGLSHDNSTTVKPCGRWAFSLIPCLFLGIWCGTYIQSWSWILSETFFPDFLELWRFQFEFQFRKKMNLNFLQIWTTWISLIWIKPKDNRLFSCENGWNPQLLKLRVDLNSDPKKVDHFLWVYLKSLAS